MDAHGRAVGIVGLRDGRAMPFTGCADAVMDGIGVDPDGLGRPAPADGERYLRALTQTLRRCSYVGARLVDD